MSRSRMLSMAVGGVFVLAACGATGAEPAAEPSPGAEAQADTSADDTPGTAAGAPAGDGSTATNAAAPATDAPAEATTTTGDAPVSDTEASREPAAGESSAGSTVNPSVVPPTTAAPGASGADDGCSTGDVTTDVAAGPVPTLDVRAASTDNPLPDLAVRRINCAGGWVNLKNELPADRPVLVWFWAPH